MAGGFDARGPRGGGGVVIPASLVLRRRAAAASSSPTESVSGRSSGLLARSPLRQSCLTAPRAGRRTRRPWRLSTRTTAAAPRRPSSASHRPPPRRTYRLPTHRSLLAAPAQSRPRRQPPARPPRSTSPIDSSWRPPGCYAPPTIARGIARRGRRGREEPSPTTERRSECQLRPVQRDRAADERRGERDRVRYVTLPGDGLVGGGVRICGLDRFPQAQLAVGRDGSLEGVEHVCRQQCPPFEPLGRGDRGTRQAVGAAAGHWSSLKGYVAHPFGMS